MRWVPRLALTAAIGASLVSCNGAPLGRGMSCLPAQPSASPSPVEPGGELTVTSSGFDSCGSNREPGDYFLVLGTEGREPPTALGTVTIGSDGTFTSTVTIPPAMTPGVGHISIPGYPPTECDDSGSCVGFSTSILIAGSIDPGR